jgi:predicted aspartyl protease
MITGRVTALREATVDLTVTGPNQRRQGMDAVLDTGFNGFLTRPNDVVRALARLS